jgi:hypothetical protein
VTTPDWESATPQSSPRIFDWGLTAKGCSDRCNDWNHNHPEWEDPLLRSSTHLEVHDAW